MRAPGKETTLEQANSSLAIDRECAVARDRFLPAPAEYGHFLTIARTAADIAADLTFSWAQFAPDQRQVTAFDAAGGKLLA